MKWKDIMWAVVGVAVIAYAQRKFSSITFDDFLRRCAEKVRATHGHDKPLPVAALRDIYDSTR